MATQPLPRKPPASVMPPSAAPSNGAAGGALVHHPNELIRLAIMQKADATQLRELMQLRIDWQKWEARQAFDAAKHAFKAEAPTIVKNATAKIRGERGEYEYSYAELDKACDVILPLLSKHGIDHRWRFDQASRPGWVRVTCVLTHKDGHEQESSLEAPEDHTGGKNPIQAISSTVTYMERITLLAVCGLAARGMDTDGHVPKVIEGRAPKVTGAEAIATDPAAGEFLSKARVDKMLAEISRAKTNDEVRAAFRAAYSEATRAGNKRAQDAYIAAKARRHSELRGRR